MKILIVYSSVTGNTKKIAEKIADTLGSNAELKNVNENIDFAAYKNIMIGFWIDKNMPDEAIKKVLPFINRKNVAFFATMGAQPTKEYSDVCLCNAAVLLPRDNRLLPLSYVCRGKVDEKLTMKLQEQLKSSSDEILVKRLQSHIDASAHPDQKDLKEAAEFAGKVAKLFADLQAE